MRVRANDHHVRAMKARCEASSFHDPLPTMASATRNPILCRVGSNFNPGLPNPTTNMALRPAGEDIHFMGVP